MKTANLIEALLKDHDLEPFYKGDGKLRFYCYGGKFLDVSKTGKLTKHEYNEYFSLNAAGEKKEFEEATEHANLIRIYTPGNTVYNASKEALKNRSENKRPFSTSKAKQSLLPEERLYQQTISRNNRPGIGRNSGMADFSFGISSKIFRKDDSKGATFVDMIWVDEDTRQIAFIEYKQGSKAFNGKSGLREHCAKTFLSMVDKEVKKAALTRYFAKKALCNGEVSTSTDVWENRAASVVNEYDSVCVFLFTDVEKDIVISRLKELKKDDHKINKLIRDLFNLNAQDEMYPNGNITVQWHRVKYVYCKSYKDVYLSQKALEILD